jgi:uncharacterized protein
MEAAIATSDRDIGETVAELAPVQASERIHALDIVRGFALIGIFLMNVEWFTRPISELGTGVDVTQTGIHYFASWFVYAFVQGKFWTMFSLLFGMGFAVMLGRAESTERAFMAPYIRRIIGLFLFGSAHYVMVWTGDILHNYAFTAIFLLLITSNSWKTTLALLLSFAGTGAALYFLGHEKQSEPFGMHAMLLLLTGVLTNFLNRGSIARYWKWGVTLYSLPFLISLVFVGVNALKPAEAEAQKTRQEQLAEKGREAAAVAAKPSDDKSAAKPEEKDEATRRAERKAEREKERKELVALYTTGSYWESIVYRVKEYAQDIKFAAGLSGLALPMFLIGFWFVRSGVIGNLREHLPLFRKLAMIVLPIGLAMTLTAVSLHSSYLNADWDDPTVRLAQTLFQWGMMPQCIGYVALMICLIHTEIGSKLLSPLRYAGQMALTNYIGANAIGMWFFSGYGLGYYGHVPRGGQVLFVFVVFALQLVLSIWWLSKFRYGPLEWVWRAITYWQLPPMRRPVTV